MTTAQDIKTLRFDNFAADIKEFILDTNQTIYVQHIATSRSNMSSSFKVYLLANVEDYRHDKTIQLQDITQFLRLNLKLKADKDNNLKISACGIDRRCVLIEEIMRYFNKNISSSDAFNRQNVIVI